LKTKKTHFIFLCCGGFELPRVHITLLAVLAGLTPNVFLQLAAAATSNGATIDANDSTRYDSSRLASQTNFSLPVAYLNDATANERSQ
jgi:hypothetical protein